MAKPPKGGDAKPDGSNASPNGEYAMTAGCNLHAVFRVPLLRPALLERGFFSWGWPTIRQTFRVFCEGQEKGELLSQWDAEKNLPLTPDDVTFGSHKRVWWRCPKGHSWRAALYSRTTLGTGCPVCTGKQALAGENDLATLYPDIAAQWDETKNGTLRPSNVTADSNRRVWWKCEKGHSCRAVIAQRVQRGDGCPYCANRKVLPGFNDLATVQPLVAKQWHETLNGALTPEMVTAGSHKKAWWQCSYGHVWKAAIYSRAGVQQCGCPVCAGKTRRKTK